MGEGESRRCVLEGLGEDVRSDRRADAGFDGKSAGKTGFALIGVGFAVRAADGLVELAPDGFRKTIKGRGGNDWQGNSGRGDGYRCGLAANIESTAGGEEKHGADEGQEDQEHGQSHDKCFRGRGILH